MNQKFDIIIGGAGPAGLLLSKELSKYFDVLVLEKENVGKSHITCYTYQDRVKKYKMHDAVMSTCDKIEFRTIYNHHFMIDKCAIIDKNILLSRWAEDNNSEFSQENISDVRHYEGSVRVITNKSEYEADLFIDCMGANSPLIWKKNLVKFFKVWSCYGGSLTNLNPPDHLQFFPMNDKYNTYLMHYNFGPSRMHAVLFRNLAENTNPVDIMSSQFKSVMKRFPGAKCEEILFGNIMTGALKKTALDNMLFYGDSGMFTPSACGMGFNQCLQTHQKMSKEVKQHMDSNQLSEKKLAQITPNVLNQNAMDFMQIVNKVGFYNNTQEGWKNGVDWLNEMGRDSKYWMRNEFSAEWGKKALKAFFKTNALVDIAKTVPASEYYFIVKTASRILKNFAVYEAKDLFYRQRKGLADRKILRGLFGDK